MRNPEALFCFNKDTCVDRRRDGLSPGGSTAPSLSTKVTSPDVTAGGSWGRPRPHNMNLSSLLRTKATLSLIEVESFFLKADQQKVLFTPYKIIRFCKLRCLIICEFSFITIRGVLAVNRGERPCMIPLGFAFLLEPLWLLMCVLSHATCSGAWRPCCHYRLFLECRRRSQWMCCAPVSKFWA